MILITRYCNTCVNVERESFLFHDCMSEIYPQSVFVWFVRLPHFSCERLVNSNMRKILSLLYL
jgi:hypothetical protein